MKTLYKIRIYIRFYIAMVGKFVFFKSDLVSPEIEKS